MPSFSIASCSNGAEIHSMELLYFREKTNWFSKEVRPLKPYKNEDKHILQEQDVGKEETPTSNDLFFLLKEKRLGNITDSCMARKAISFYGDSRTNFGSLTHYQINMTESHDRLAKV